jgi:hypothetical protein
VISYFSVRKPTDEEISSLDRCPQINMTADATWDPYDELFGKSEKITRGNLTSFSETKSQRHISLTPVDVSSISTIYDETLFLRKLTISEITSNKRKGTVNEYELAKRWFIGIDTARKTIEATTQRGVRDFLS